MAVLKDFQPIKFGFARCHEWVAECIYAESSAFSGRAFYVQAFALPLFIPTDHLYFDYGFRVGDRWEAVTDALIRAVQAALPSLRALATLDGLVHAASNPSSNLYHAEIHLCVGLLRDDQDSIRECRERINSWRQQLPWEEEVLSRCRRLLETFDAHGKASVLAELRRRAETVRLLFDE